MNNFFDFDIISNGKISNEFLIRNISNFNDAANFIKKLNYFRNKNKGDLTTVFADNCGTCSTKHALLKILAEENNNEDLKLMLGIFRMDKINTPAVANILADKGLNYIPEAHNYLKFGKQILDFTNMRSKPSNFENDLLTEIEITPNQISDFKIEYHKRYLKDWLNKSSDIKFTLDEIWSIREQCIKKLSQPFLHSEPVELREGRSRNRNFCNL